MCQGHALFRRQLIGRHVINAYKHGTGVADADVVELLRAAPGGAWPMAMMLRHNW